MARRFKAAVAAATMVVAAMTASAGLAEGHGHGHGHGFGRGDWYGYGYGGYGWGHHWRGYYGPWFGGPWFWGGVAPAYYYPYAPYYYYAPYGAPPPYYSPAPVSYRPRRSSPRQAPAAAPAAAPASSAARELERFVVYFPFDRDDLTPGARGVIRAAAAYEARNGRARVIIVGHTDTSGSEGYNQPLSERRARVVRGALVAEGVDPGVVQMDWRGKHDLAVQTGEGVKEALNRRTTILMQPAG